MIPGKGVSQGHQEAHNTLNICRDNSIQNRANIYDTRAKLLLYQSTITYQIYQRVINRFGTF
jgi:hypothetical protein